MSVPSSLCESEATCSVRFEGKSTALKPGSGAEGSAGPPNYTRREALRLAFRRRTADVHPPLSVTQRYL